MINRQKHGILIVCGIIIGCLLLNWLSSDLEGSEKRYEVRPEITLPEYRTDVDRILDAYERLMNNYLKITERNLLDVGRDVSDVAEKLDQLDGKLGKLSLQLESIQKKLGIDIQPLEKTPSGNPASEQRTVETESH